MHMRFVGAALASAGLLVTAVQGRAAVVIQSRLATLQVNTMVGNVTDDYLDQSTTPTGAYANARTSGTPFTPPATGAYATANQATTVAQDALGNLSVTGTGTASGQARGSLPATPALTNALSSLRLTIEVTGSPALYTLSGTVFADRPAGTALTIANVSLTQNDVGNTSVASFNGTTNLVPTPFATSGTLNPGTYFFVMQAVRNVPPTTTGAMTAGTLGTGNFTDVVFTVSVPEPAGVGVALLAGVGLTRRARRARRAA